MQESKKEAGQESKQETVAETEPLSNGPTETDSHATTHTTSAIAVEDGKNTGEESELEMPAASEVEGEGEEEGENGEGADFTIPKRLKKKQQKQERRRKEREEALEATSSSAATPAKKKTTTARSTAPSKKRLSSPRLVKRVASKQFLLASAPAVLILHLKRFMQTGWGGFEKDSRHVKFPLVLDATPMLAPGVAPAAKKVLYKLLGVVMHGGSLNSGHYTAVVRKALPDGTNKWLYFSDTHVKETTEADVLSAEAYLLFYEKHNVS